jgi:hypothetical protein
MKTDVTMDLLQLHNNLNRNITMDTAVWYMSERLLGTVCERAWRARSLFGALLIGERNTWVYTVDDEDIRLSGLVQVNDGL